MAYIGWISFPLKIGRTQGVDRCPQAQVIWPLTCSLPSCQFRAKWKVHRSITTLKTVGGPLTPDSGSLSSYSHASGLVSGTVHFWVLFLFYGLSAIPTIFGPFMYSQSLLPCSLAQRPVEVSGSALVARPQFSQHLLTHYISSHKTQSRITTKLSSWKVTVADGRLDWYLLHPESNRGL